MVVNLKFKVRIRNNNIQRLEINLMFTFELSIILIFNNFVICDVTNVMSMTN